MTGLSNKPVPTIKQKVRAKYQSSGLSDAHARKLGLKALTAAQVTARSARFYEAGALFIPYFDLSGKPTKFYRLRYLERLPGAAGAIENPQRYDQLPVLQEVYYPPLLSHSWEDISKDLSVPVFITEGELKAACACTQAFPTMALGGVHSFMSSKRGVAFLPSLEKFDWKERTVYVVFDNDITHKLPVMRAQRDLATALTERGAKVFSISIPKGPDKGLDDYLVKFGRDKFEELIEEAEAFSEAQELWKLNEEVVLIRGIDIVVERSTNQLMFPDQFIRHLYANRFYIEKVIKGSGKNQHLALEKAPLADKWVKWEHRAELAELTYEPGSPKVVGGRAWNTWKGWGVKPKQGDVGPWKWLLDFLFANDKKARHWFEQWCAYPIQHPGTKLYTASVLWSRVKRLGKSLVGLSLAKIYGDNAIVLGPKQLTGNFNSWASNRQLVIGEEFTSGEVRQDADSLKFLITSPTIRINEKNKPEYVHPNHMNLLIFSNHPDTVFLEDGDERYLIHGILQNSPAPRAKYEWCNAWLHGEGPSYLMDHLLRLNTKNFNPREHAPKTLSKYEMIIAGKTDVGLWILRLQEDPQTALRAYGERVADNATGCDLFTADQLYHAFDPQDRGRGRHSVASLGRSMGAAGFRQVNGGEPMGTASGIHRLYAVRNIVKWEQSTRAQIRNHYDSFFGPKMAGSVK